MKRAFDMFFSSCGLVFLVPLFAVVALLVIVDSPGPVFFRQERVGRFFNSFYIWKFRTMVSDSNKPVRLVTSGGDPRITRVGYWLRKTKIDELPQLWNVLKGEMSLVGPRPEVQRYVEMFAKEYSAILAVRPGITDLASIAYRYEEEILSQSQGLERAYVEQVLPAKIRLNLEYLHRQGFWFDLWLIGKTLTKIVGQPR
jgi:lipopolysaccharide/colanic/teichoic acid biosynthesis glycosyltransferase